MRVFLLSCLLSLSIGVSVSAERVFGLEEIYFVPAKEAMAEVKADARGGSMSFEVYYRKGCVGHYHLEWTFSKDISTLRDGDRFTIELHCVDCQTPCGYKWTKGEVSGSNNILSIPGKTYETYNGHIRLVESTARFGVHGWYPGHTQHRYEMEFTQKKEAAQTAFSITMGGHQIFYIYTAGAKPGPPATPVNCHTLFNIGKRLQSLEQGATQGYDTDWMSRTIDDALHHITSSGCLSVDFLKDLRNRIEHASDSRIFAGEISRYAHDLEDQIATDCACCHQSNSP